MFTFRFQPLLQLATSERDTARTALTEVVQAVDRLHQQRQQIADRQHSLISDDNLPRLGSIPVGSLLANSHYQRQLAREDSQLVAAAEQMEAEIERRRRELLLAETQVRKLELLRQKDQLTWSARQAKAEQAVMDEIAARGGSPMLPPISGGIGRPTVERG